MAVEFKFVFVEMGQGDCCMVRCPDGRVVVVDCGRTTNPLGDPQAFIRAQELLRTVDWAGGQGNKIAALILTHPDADHHNKVVDLCDQNTVPEDIVFEDKGPNLARGTVLAKIAIDKVYFSDATPHGRTPLENYPGGILCANICEGYFNTQELHEVSIRPKDNKANKGVIVKTVKKWSTPFGTANFTVSNLLLPQLPILSNTTEGIEWRVWIIAGNIEKMKGKDTASEDNAKSLVTLFEIGEKKALLTGDATYSTEDFLVKNHKDILNAVNLVQVPHHGSKHGSNPKTVECFTSLNRAVLSVGFMEYGYLHPQYAVLAKWLERVKGAEADEHRDIDYWTKDPGEGQSTDYNYYHDSWSNANKGIASSGSGSFWYLRKPENQVFGYKIGRATEFLYREFTPDRLDMTSQGTQVYKLSRDGVTWAKLKPPEPADNPT